MNTDHDASILAIREAYYRGRRSGLRDAARACLDIAYRLGNRRDHAGHDGAAECVRAIEKIAKSEEAS